MFGERAERIVRRQRTVLGAIALIVVTIATTWPVVFALGKRSVAATERRAQVASEGAVTRRFRAYDAETQYRMHRSELLEMFNPAAFPAIGVKYVPVLPGQPAPGTDVVVLAASAASWRALDASDRQLLVAAAAQNHQQFLALRGHPDTLHFALALAARKADPRDTVPEILAVRDRSGHIKLAPTR